MTGRGQARMLILVLLFSAMDELRKALTVGLNTDVGLMVGTLALAAIVGALTMWREISV